MDPESKKLLEKTLAIAEENNAMLKSMRNSMRWSRLMSYLYWIFIIGSAVGAFYLIQPYIDSLKGSFDNTNTQFQGLQDLF